MTMGWNVWYHLNFKGMAVMKPENKIMASSVLLGLFLWVADAVFDFALFYDGSFKEMLITRVPGHELYIRTLIFVCTVLYGLFCARIMKRQRKIKERLASALDFQEQLLNAIPIPVFYKDKDLIFSGCNKSFEAFLNMGKKDIVGKKVHDIAPEKLADIYHEKDMELLNTPGVQIYEFEAESRALGTRKIIFHKASFNDTYGRVAGMIGAILDITERKKAEEEKERLIAKLQEALDTVKTLSGLLPICASCKKIRDDNGYWNQIETYISRHSEAEFSHGICPDCLEKLYPGYAKKIVTIQPV